MLFNCFHCGKKISGKVDLCVYCKTDNAPFLSELKQIQKSNSLESREARTERLRAVRQKHNGTFFAFLFRK